MEKSADSFWIARGQSIPALQTQENDREASVPQPATVRPTRSWATSHHTVTHNIKVEVLLFISEPIQRLSRQSVPHVIKQGQQSGLLASTNPGGPLLTIS